MRLLKVSYLLFALFLLVACHENETTNTITKNRLLTIVSVSVNHIELSQNSRTNNIDYSVKPIIKIVFSDTININNIDKNSISFGGNIISNYNVSEGENNKTLLLTSTINPQEFQKYNFSVLVGNNLGGKITDGFYSTFITKLDSTSKFPKITDDSLLTLVQKQTFKYFWDYGHPVSGLARERLGSDETVTSGGSGFGIMAIPVAIERKFITRTEGFTRMNKIVHFLNQTAQKFHGAFPHWLNGTTGKVIPFSGNDNGADLVETSYLMEGLLSTRQYFINGNADEKAMCDTIQKLWRNVEWTWFQQGGQQQLYWHWSPDKGWIMGMPIHGWNECLITYILAASSPTYPITKSVYDNGWALNGSIQNGKSYYNITLPLGSDKGGPLFFAHYSFLGIDPRTLNDTYANYWTQNTAHALINYQYCIKNPVGYLGYSDQCWGLTACDTYNGYNAFSPTNDNGTIAPTAAISSLPYTPEESMQALRFFYYIIGDKIWGDYGFVDSFNFEKQWYANSYLAIDQGPIITMIENYRSRLIWNLLMQNPDIQRGLSTLGFNIK